MKSYEILMLTSARLAKDERNVVLERVEGWLKDMGTEIAESKSLGVRKLAYPIKKLDEAAYHLWFVNAPLEMPAGLAAKIRIDDDIIRHLLIERHPLAKDTIVTYSGE